MFSPTYYIVYLPNSTMLNTGADALYDLNTNWNITNNSVRVIKKGGRRGGGVLFLYYVWQKINIFIVKFDSICSFKIHLKYENRPKKLLSQILDPLPSSRSVLEDFLQKNSMLRVYSGISHYYNRSGKYLKFFGNFRVIISSNLT